MGARLRVREKKTGRTYIVYWPWPDGICLCAKTGERRFVTDAGGYSEYNDRGEPVLDSWINPLPMFACGLGLRPSSPVVARFKGVA